MAYKNYILVCAGTACESNQGTLVEAPLERVKSKALNVMHSWLKLAVLVSAKKGPTAKSFPRIFLCSR